MTKYKLVFDNTVVEFLSEAEALAFKAENSIESDVISFEEAPLVVSNVPSFVTPRQIRVALITSGFSLATIETAIDSLPEPQQSITRVTWEYSVEFQRNNPLLIAMAPMLGLTSADIDN